MQKLMFESTEQSEQPKKSRQAEDDPELHQETS